ncbi:hypothetical protein BVRB_039600, partial [Beta vulgaris subsp. vulgaris]
SLMPKIVMLKDAKSKLERGESVNVSALPQLHVMLYCAFSSQKTYKLQAAAQSTNKSELFDSLERDLKNQVTRVYDEAKQALKLDLKEDARIMMAIKVRSERELESLAQIRLRNEPLPMVTRTRRAVTSLRQFEHVGSNQLEVRVVRLSLNKFEVWAARNR